MVQVARGWIDTAGRCRTWVLLDVDGEKIAEICTKRDAEKLAALLSEQTETEKG